MSIKHKITVLTVIFIAATLIFAGCDIGNDVQNDPNPGEENNKLSVSVREPNVEVSSMSGISQADVSLEGSKNLTTETDNEGNAVFADLPSGTFDLTASKTGYKLFNTEIAIQQTGNETTILSQEIVIREENSAEIIPKETEYNVAQPDDVSVLIEWNNANKVTEVSLVMDRENFDVEAAEFSFLNENTGTLIIKKDFLENIAEPETEINIYVGFDEGSDGLLTINVVDKEIKTDAEITPSRTDFNLADPKNVRTTITWNQATVLENLRLNLQDEDYSMQNINDNYTLEDNTLVIYRDFLLEQNYNEGDMLEFVLDFDKGNSATLEVKITDLKDDEKDEDKEEDEDNIEPGDITVTGGFDISHSFPHSKVEMNTESMGDSELWQAESDEVKTFSQDKEDELILRFDRGLSENEATEKAESLGYKKLDFMPEINAMLVKLPAENNIIQAQNQIKDEFSILSAQKNNVFTILDYQEPNDEYYNKQWAAPVMRLPQTWRDVKGASNIRVAILDTGIDYNHVEMKGLVDKSSGYNFSSDDETDFIDRHNHGTHVAGIVGAKSNNDIGLAGVMWDVELLPVKVLDDYGGGDEWSVAKGILHAAGLRDESPIQPADVINMSLGMSGSNPTPKVMEDAVKRAADAGVIIVAASGNSGDENVGYPAKFADVIAVGALSENTSGAPELASYSSYGPEIDLTAPGTAIWSTVTNNHILSMSGTSMAAPQVAGLAGLMVASGIPHNDVLDVMQKTAIDLGDPGYNKYYGHGMINTYWATQEATEIKIAVGERIGREFNIVAENSVPVTAGEFAVNGVPAGDYEVMIWLDVRGSVNLENGDYFATTGKVELTEGEYSFNLTAEEFHE